MLSNQMKSLFIYLFIPDISIALLQVHYYSEALPTQHGYCAGVSRRSATGNCSIRTCPRSLRRGKSGIRTHDLPVERYRLNQCATTSKLQQQQFSVPLFNLFVT